MSPSKNRSIKIQLGIDVAQKQRLKSQRRRKESQRYLDQCSEFGLAEDVPDEEPPIHDIKWHEVYWNHTDDDASRWDENSDVDESAEREQTISVEGSGKETCTTYPFEPLTGGTIKLLRSVMADGRWQQTLSTIVQGWRLCNYWWRPAKIEAR